MDLLIDSDCLVYMFAHRNQEKIAFQVNGDGEKIVTLMANLDRAIANLNDFVADLQAKLGGGRIFMALSDTGPDSNFRKRINPSYKGNRAAVERPLLYSDLRTYILARRDWRPLVKPGLEGDDVLGVWASMPNDGESIICSIDKDMLTIPGLHYNWDHPGEGVITVTPSEAQRYFYTQVLTGDSTDGYKGLPGCGPVSAGRIMEPFDDELSWDEVAVWDTIVAAYAKKGLTENDAILQARMARILIDSAGAQILWTPPKETDSE